MASSFIKYNNDKGFWIDDDIFEVFCHYLWETIENSNQEQNPWLKELSELVYNNSQGYYRNYMHLELKEHLTDQIKAGLFLNILDQLIQKLEEKGDVIQIEELNTIPKEPDPNSQWATPFEINRLVKIAKFLKLLVSGEITTTAADPITYSF